MFWTKSVKFFQQTCTNWVRFNTTIFQYLDVGVGWVKHEGNKKKQRLFIHFLKHKKKLNRTRKTRLPFMLYFRFYHYYAIIKQNNWLIPFRLRDQKLRADSTKPEQDTNPRRLCHKGFSPTYSVNNRFGAYRCWLDGHNLWPLLFLKGDQFIKILTNTDKRGNKRLYYDGILKPQPKGPNWYFRIRLDPETRLSHQLLDEARS